MALGQRILTIKTEQELSASNAMASKERPIERKRNMPKQNDKKQEGSQSVEDLIKALNEDLAREYQAIIAYIVYSNVLSGAKWMQIAAELKKHAAEELQHALIIADQIDYLGGMQTASPKEVKLSDKAEEMLRFDLDNETETIRNYRTRVKQAEALGHYALAEQLRKIISQEQEHQHDLATALGIDVPNVLPQGA
jgi:bacterioferritin